MEALLPENYIERINHIGVLQFQDCWQSPQLIFCWKSKREADFSKIESKLKRAGWTLMHRNQKDEELDLVFNKGYTPEGFADKVFHLHLRYPGDRDELYFRDYLIAHPEIAEKYGELKKSLASDFKHNRDGYTEAKTGFIKKWTAEARKEFKDKYLPE